MMDSVFEDEFRWLDKCEKNKVKIPYDAFRACLNRLYKNYKNTDLKGDNDA